MKRLLATLLVVTLCGAMLSGCNDTDSRNDGNEQVDSHATTTLAQAQTTTAATLAPTSAISSPASTASASVSTTLASASTTGTVTKTEPSVTITIEEPPLYQDYDFDSYAELVQALTVPGSDGYDDLHEEMSAYVETTPFGKIYSNMLTLLEQGKLEVLVPQRNGETMPLRTNKITLFSAELYNLPWVWYHCDVDDQLVHVKYTYVSAIDHTELEQVTTIRQFLSLIAPTAPSPTNLKSYKRIYEQEVVLVDGSSVSAWIYEMEDTSRTYVQYYQDGMVVWVWADKQLLEDDLLSSFDLVPYSEAVG